MRWEAVERRLGATLRTAARAARLAAGELIKYEASATHQEILAGLGTKPEEREHVFAFLRNPDGTKVPELASLIGILRRDLPEGNVFSFAADNLDELCRRVTETLTKVIDAEAAGFQSRSPLKLEQDAQNAFARDRARHFVGRHAVRRRHDQRLFG